MIHLLFLSRLQTWQYLVDLPYDCMSTKMLWKLFWSFHIDCDSVDAKSILYTEADFQEDWRKLLYGIISFTSKLITMLLYMHCTFY